MSDRADAAWQAYRDAKFRAKPVTVENAFKAGFMAGRSMDFDKLLARIHFVFTDELRAARNAKGWSLQKAAGELGISKPHLHELEKGTARNPTGKVIAAIVRVYGLDPAAVIGSFQ